MKSFIARIVTWLLAKITPADVKSAASIVNEYRANGGGSNRTNWTQVQGILSAVITVIRTGRAVEITGFYMDQIGTKSPAYNLAHRQLSAGVIRPYWHRVQVVALVDATVKGSEVSGVPNTTIPMGTGVRLFLVPTTEPTKVPAKVRK